MRWIRLAICAIGLSMAQSAAAYVECTSTVASIFSTDEGAIYIYWVEGGSGLIGYSDPDRPATLALATTALVTDRTVTVRYADGTSCTAHFRPINGLQLNR